MEGVLFELLKALIVIGMLCIVVGFAARLIEGFSEGFLIFAFLVYDAWATYAAFTSGVVRFDTIAGLAMPWVVSLAATVVVMFVVNFVGAILGLSIGAGLAWLVETCFSGIVWAFRQALYHFRRWRARSRELNRNRSHG